MAKQQPTATQDITFSDFCTYLDKIASRKSKKAGARKQPAHDSSNQAAEDFEEWVNLHWPVSRNTGKIIFRLLFPNQDVRRTYGLKEAKLGKYLGTLFSVQTGRGKRGEGLVAWNSTTEDQNGLETGRAGCLGLELEKILTEGGHNKYEVLKLSDVDQFLDELAAKSPWSNLGKGPARPPPRPDTDILHNLYIPLSARQAAYMTQIILKDLRPLLYPIPSLSVYRSLTDYDSTAFKEISPYCMMKAWHWAMPTIYRAKADFDVAADLCEQIPRDKTQLSTRTKELLRRFAKPKLGTCVNIPKCVKASGPCLAAPLSKLTDQVWAETKMDGERMQIHIDTSKPKTEQIQIFSKSHRDSTSERAPTHDLIRATLGLHSKTTPESLGSLSRPKTHEQIKSGIFEAEMVAWNMDQGQVDEFWRIRELKKKPGQVDDNEIDNRPTTPSTDSQDDTNSQHLSDRASRHLALCFFDVLYLNGESLLESPYNQRRRTLETCIHVIPHFSMLVDRKSFDMSRESGKEALRQHYARVIAERHEGLILKTAASVYNDSRSEHKWLKVKKDYIAGYGDTADYAIIGAAWDQNRGRELGVPTSTYTSWYIGMCDNTLDIERTPGTRPHFRLIFTFLSYGFTRQQLERANRIAQDAGGETPDISEARQDWPFTFEVARDLKKPAVIFKKPLVFELMGSGFTKRSRKHEYELRWPRITKMHDPGERDWTDAVDLETHDEMAQRATDPKLLNIADLISGGSQQAAENGFQAEVDKWSEKLKTGDLNWRSRGRNLPSDLSETSARVIAHKPAKFPHPNFDSPISKGKKSSKSDQQTEGTSRKSRVLSTPDDTAIVADVEPTIRSKSSTSKEVQAGVQSSPQAELTLFSGIESIMTSLKRKASGSEIDKGTSAAPQMVLDSEHGAESKTKRRKTSDQKPHPEVFPERATLVTAPKEKSALPKFASPKDTPTSRKRPIPRKSLETPPAKRSSTLTRVQSSTSSITGSVAPEMRNYFANDLLDIEKEAMSSPLNPIKDPPAGKTSIPNITSSANLTSGLIASSSISVQLNQPVTDPPPQDRSTTPPVQKSRPGPLASVTHGIRDIEASTSASSGNPGLEIANAKSSAPPWHQKSDVQWCLVHDEQTYGIQGTKFGSVSQLLQSLEINQKEFDHKPQTDSASYIFIENPTPESLCRVQKQVLFRSLSNPSIGVVGYDAKVLKLPQSHRDAWKTFELFRFDPCVQELEDSGKPNEQKN
ncbi:hypothetical protein PTTG_00480 [Puccinia triticina 1-1 BBBD Race 1]|uniref:DNA_LIGASE_A3 domain-containing protein n=2 Tax=Puccinia triticina TaxID=208348 RepID=A0A180H4N1_PUCT1|nr:uncharacterized protein PtA15_2A556 [Puccinia triticina]OAV99744.1 hypothetical protein PTTG_00480 [Puccinia triticina 1-1 BBBD Race 1]WAQ82239.1 hypothetical protein PtA15_2A556 [Puccinia triticina]WAR53092.1 hypothetical protein PtB15_2B522 [Puccinia triticina]